MIDVFKVDHRAGGQIWERFKQLHEEIHPHWIAVNNLSTCIKDKVSN